jgi:AraC-like DNA-binding protein
MVPVSFLIALPVFLMAVFLFSKRSKAPEFHWAAIFLTAVFLQLILVGMRFGYGVAAVTQVHGVLNVLLPPMAYLSFSRMKLSWRDLLHILPVSVANLLVWVLVPDVIDLFMGSVSIVYIVALLNIARSSEWWFDWAPVRWANYLVVALWMTIAMQTVSGLTDFAIAMDFLFSKGERIAEIVGWACLAGLVIYTLAYLVWLVRNRKRKITPPSEADRLLLDQLSTELNRNDLFSDPELSLDRVSRRLSIPSRQISEAVNRAKGQNFSQVINDHRINAACAKLRQTQEPVTTIMLDVGFFTKSNFNREFKRVTGMTPTGWRKQIRSASKSPT